MRDSDGFVLPILIKGEVQVNITQCRIIINRDKIEYIGNAPDLEEWSTLDEIKDYLTVMYMDIPISSIEIIEEYDLSGQFYVWSCRYDYWQKKGETCGSI